MYHIAKKLNISTILLPLLVLGLGACQPSAPEMAAEARRLLEEEKPEEAKEWLEKALAQDSTLASAWLMKGSIHFQQEELTAAKHAFEKALFMDAEDYKAWYNLGNVFREKADTAKALAHYTEAIVKAPTVADIYANRAFILDQMGLVDRAKEDLTMALQLEPRPIFYLNLGKLQLKSAEAEKALSAFEQAGKNPELNTEATYLRAITLSLLALDAEACKTMEVARQKGEPRAAAWLEKNC